MSESVSVVGLGKLGLGLSLCMAEAGIETLGVDVNAGVVESIQRLESPIQEPGYDELIKKLGPKFAVTTDHAEAIESREPPAAFRDHGDI